MPMMFNQMNPLAAMLAKQGNPMAAIAAKPPTASAAAPGATPGLMSPEQLSAVMGAVESPNPPSPPPLPYTTMPNAPRAMNPQMSANLLQMMLGLNNPQRMPSLGQLLGGGGR